MEPQPLPFLTIKKTTHTPPARVGPPDLGATVAATRGARGLVLRFPPPPSASGSSARPSSGTRLPSPASASTNGGPAARPRQPIQTQGRGLAGPQAPPVPRPLGCGDPEGVLPPRPGAQCGPNSPPSGTHRFSGLARPPGLAMVQIPARASFHLCRPRHPTQSIIR